jgi:ribose transport system permease protein
MANALETSSRPRRAERIWRALSPRRLNALYLGLFFVVLFSLLNPATFFTPATMTVILGGGAVTCLLALAFLVPLATNSFDLSVGVMMTFALTITTKLYMETGIPLVVIAVITVAACGAIGALSGFIVVRLRVNSFIATLGVSQVLLALVLLISDNKQLVGRFPDWWATLGNGSILYIPLPFFLLLLVALVMWYVLEQTRVGRYLFATGGSVDAARLSGVKTGRMIWGSFIFSAMICGLAGLVYSMKIGVSTPSVGDGLLFPAVAAVFLGASQLSMRPNVWGTLIAYFALAAGIQGLTLSTGAGAKWSGPLFQGVALIVAVSIASRPLIRKIRERKGAVKSDAIPAIPVDQPAGVQR